MWRPFEQNSNSAKTGPPFRQKWRAAADEDGHYCFAVAL
jgi:hypothetical protein